MDAVVFTGAADGLSVVAYPGDNKILLAMSLAVDAVGKTDGKNLAGFAIWRTRFGMKEEILSNRIGFTIAVEGASDGKWTPSDKAPFQKFRWIDVPPDGFDKPMKYRIRALFFAGDGHDLTDGPEVTLDVQPARNRHSAFRAAFTRGYIASQAYADKFQNKDIRPSGPKSPTFDTAPFQPQYKWLGADAREELMAFIADCEKDTEALVDVFAYDLDEPDVIAAICAMGKQGRLRAILDNAPLHAKVSKSHFGGGDGTPPPEIEAAKMIIDAAGADNVRQGHFQRFQHNKVFIKRDAAGKGQRVLFGSMNFSVRGIYVQANNVMVVDDSTTADMFAKAFDVAFADDVTAPLFRQNPISQGFMVCSAQGSDALPKFSLALSPHTNWSVSLGPMVARMRAATSSILYAVMAPTGGGPVLSTLRIIAGQPTIFSYGTVETDKGLAVQNPQGQMGGITSFAALTKNVPAPFTKEFSGGPGMHIHDKFVVVDFNGDNPTVFSGSSNLAAGGETQNGDSLAMIEDASIANMFAVEALALFDHYHFRSDAAKATKAEPITLWSPDKGGTPWWQPYYDESSIKMRDRCLFAKIELPAGMESVKSVDWASVDAQDSAASGSGKARRKGAAAPVKTAARATTGAAATRKAKPAKSDTKAEPSAKKSVAKKSAAKHRPKKRTKAASLERKPAKKVAKRKSPVRKAQGTAKAKKRARKRA
ncbi:hypothetical protein RHAL1_00978 [Beijerinckiaceae bacterium RH AL1]|nr:phospholipase D-like domain-containing protein [Beijerinckiaceae bacterium]VVB43929.1 hypothetical protein RHCH11_RHCH11_00953 [Beijerinckiaceae bacterium RH CH11]VVB43956.1 hypothetical protein RHAL8_00950 [Beijerinckiaceae bacterium RH AL8]VVC54085.1 hypothetical protein RHAL1_00978 [Beijerinckiaceae bacterium RH AL1]